MAKSHHTRKGVVRKHSKRTLGRNPKTGLLEHKTTVKKY